MAIKPPHLAIRPPDLTTKSPEMTRESLDMDIRRKETDPRLVYTTNEYHASHLYDPHDLAIAWTPS